MIFSFLGSISIGLVWGWLATKLFFQARPNFKQLLAFITITSTFIGEVKYFYDWHHVGGLLLGTLISSLFHYLWLKQLQKNALNQN